MTDPILLFDAAGVLALAKPAGLATQAPPGIESVEAWVRQRLHGGSPRGYVGVPHRLDRAVSGVLLMAATPRAARKLSRQFEQRLIRKTYVAIVERRLNPPAGLADGASEAWRDFLEKVPDEPRSRLAGADQPAAREALTRARAVAPLKIADRRRLLLELEPLTGRMHQLRLQAASRGLPIVGDRLYDPEADCEWWREGAEGGEAPAGAVLREPPIALHAWRICYADPDTGQEVTAAAPLPDYWPAAARVAVE